MVPVIAFLLLACNPAGTAFDEAEQLAVAGRYDEAIVKYDQVAQGWPDSPEAKMVPAALDRATIGKVKAKFAAADWDGVDAEMTVFNKRSQDAYQEFVGSPEGEPYYVAAFWTTFRKPSVTPSDVLLDFVVERWPRQSGALAEAMAKDTCGRLTEFPAWAACDGLPKPDLGPNVKVPPDLATITDISALSTAIEACPKVMPVKPMCPDAAEAFAVLPDVAAMEARRAELAQADAAKLTEQITAAGKAWCSADAAWDRMTEQQALLVLNNRLGSALAMESESSAAGDRARAKRDTFEDLEGVLKAAPWPADVKKLVQAEYDTWEKKCD